MKNKASSFVKHVISVMASVAKTKSMALKSKVDALRSRIIIFSLLRNRKVLMGSISDKIQALLHHQQGHEDTSDEQSKAIALYTPMANMSNPEPSYTELADEMEEPSCTELMDEMEEDDKYPDFTHSLFDDLTTGSVIDLVRNAKGDGEEFRLEDEIDHVADLFITRFHRQLRLQKQQSFERYEEMLGTSV